MLAALGAVGAEQHAGLCAKCPGSAIRLGEWGFREAGEAQSTCFDLRNGQLHHLRRYIS